MELCLIYIFNGSVIFTEIYGVGDEICVYP